MEFVTLGKYAVKISRCGCVVSTTTNKSLKASPDKAGYPRIYAKNIDGKRYGHYVHRLLAIAFIPNPYQKKCVNHRDGNKSNHAIENLEWCTPTENQLHSHAMKLFKKKDRSYWKEDRNAAIFELRALGVSQSVIAKAFSISAARVSIILTTKN